MTIPRQLAANRRNARLGTGPRSAAGKRSVAVNALRHGLSIPVFVDPGLATEVVELAERIAKATDRLVHGITSVDHRHSLKVTLNGLPDPHLTNEAARA